MCALPCRNFPERHGRILLFFVSFRLIMIRRLTQQPELHCLCGRDLQLGHGRLEVHWVCRWFFQQQHGLRLVHGVCAWNGSGGPV